MDYLTLEQMEEEGIVNLQAIWTLKHEPAWLVTLVDGSQVIIQHDTEMWGRLPTMLDYLDTEDLYDVEKIEAALFEASKRRGW
jgi:hypothetical protein